MAFGNAIKKSNIAENWLFQFGFYNGDADGNGDGGFSAVTQDDTNNPPNLCKGAINDANATAIDVDDTTVFIVGDFIKIDSEILKITGITDADTLAVTRGKMGTTAATHSDDAVIYWQNFFSMAFSDTTYNDVFYHGVVLNRPSIRESIDLANSTAKTSNISITIPDFQYQGSAMSKELFGGTNNYINQEVKILSQVDADTPSQIGSFRLVDISTDGININLSLASHRPWDFITIPSVKSNNNNYAPVSYGNYTKNTATSYSSAQYHPDTGYTYRPVPFDKNIGDNDYYLSRPGTNNKSNSDLAYYDKSLQSFIPLANPLTTTTAETNVSHTYIARGLLRGFKQTGATTTTVNDLSYTLNSAAWEDADQAIDKNSSTVATFDTQSHTYTTVINNGTGDKLRINLTKPDGTMQRASCSATYNFVFTAPGSSTSGDTITIRVYLVFSTGESAHTAFIFLSNGSTYTSTAPSSGATTFNNQTVTQTLGSADDSEEDPDTFPAYVDFYLDVVSVTQNTDLAGHQPKWKLEAKEITMTSEWKQDKLEEPYPVLYVGAAGEANGITGSSGTARALHEMHIDLLNEYTGLDVDTDVETDVDGWSELNAARIIWVDSGANAAEALNNSETTFTVTDGTQFSAGDIIQVDNDAENMLVVSVSSNDLTISRAYNYTSAEEHDNSTNVYIGTMWESRYWQTEPTELKNILEQAQREGCFIFRYKQGDSTLPQYIHISNSPTTNSTLSMSDISDIDIKTTSMSELITKRTINSKKNPADRTYFDSIATEDTTNNPRRKWNIKTKENVEEVNLEMLVTNIGDTNPGNDSPNDSFAGYYNNIFGDIKLLVSCTIVNPIYYSLEVGDIIEFDENNMFPETPLGYNSATWNNLKMMIVSTNRTPGKLSITAREV